MDIKNIICKIGKILWDALRVLIVLVVAIVILAIVVIWLRVEFISTYKEPQEGYYQIENTQFDKAYLRVENFDIEIIYSDEHVTYFGKSVFDVKWNFWEHLAGDIYFIDKSILSAKTAPASATPATITMRCIDNYVGFNDGEFEVVKGDFDDGIMTSEIMFYDNYITLDGVRLNKVDDADIVLLKLVELFIDPVIEREKMDE